MLVVCLVAGLLAATTRQVSHGNEIRAGDSTRLSDLVRNAQSETDQVADTRDQLAAQVESLMKQVKETCGGLDILVNNAGIIRDRTLKKMTLDEWRAVIQTNLDGVFHCCKYGTEILRDGGRVVSIASVAGHSSAASACTIQSSSM